MAQPQLLVKSHISNQGVVLHYEKITDCTCTTI